MSFSTARKIEEDISLNPRLNRAKMKVLPSSLTQYLNQWDKKYKELIKNIPIFKKETDFSWSLEKKQYFVKLFYHARGHLSEFLWYMGNVAPSTEAKELVLYNYAEEFGGHSFSHEQLYFFFAENMGISSPSDVVDEKFYKPFLRKFNQAHVDWLKTHNWHGCLGAYAAYERLDNLDYVNLLHVAERLGADTKGLIFFKVHSEVEHFDATTNLLAESWQADEKTVRDSFEFIADHQAKMWKQLSDEMSFYPNA